MTPAQRQVYEFIAAFTLNVGYPPTRAEIAQGMGYSSANAAQCHIVALQKLGALWVGKGGARKLTVNAAWSLTA